MSNDSFPELNLPAAELKIRDKEGKREVFDPVRRKYVLLSPEEWVRQHLLDFLIRFRNYPVNLLAVEYALKVNRLNKRCDIIAFSKALKPLLIIEVKAPLIRLSQGVLDQVFRYNMNFGAPYLVISNGLRHYVLRIGPSWGSPEVLEDIPGYDQVIRQ